MSGFVGLNRNLYDLTKQTEILAQIQDAIAIDCEAMMQERADIIAALTTFYRAQLSISSVQPILDLAVKLNPALKEERHQLAVVKS